MDYRFFIILFIFSFSSGVIFCQDDERIDYNPSKEEVEADKLGERAIILKLKLDTLRKEIDSLKSYSLIIGTDLVNAKKELLELVGHTSESLNEFRRKFEETEKRIKNKDGLPMDAKKYYFDEISNDRARCLPEFADRYESMKKLLIPWCCSDEIITTVVHSKDSYEVKDGDYLEKIAKNIYGNEKYWEIIWEANKDGVINRDNLPENKKTILDPNKIFPGQILQIPSK